MSTSRYDFSVPIDVNGVNIGHDASMSTSEKTASRARYHHGDLRNALAVAALELAREGGPDAVVLREAARRVGVSATAAYRHFAGQLDLLIEVKYQALGILAGTIAEALEDCDKDKTGIDPGELAVARLRSAAYAYLRFAFTEQGLFNTAFCHGDHADSDFPQGNPNYTGVEAFLFLGGLLDDLVATGRMTAQRRPYAEIAAWTAVHGIAVLFVHGPLRHLPEDARDAAVNCAIEVNIRGLTCEAG